MNRVDKYIGYFGTVFLNIFGWFVVLMIPALEITTCTMGSEDAWSGTGIFYIPLMALISIFLLRCKSVSWAKWLSLPQVFLIPWAAFVVLKYLIGVTVQGHHFCAVLRDPGFNSYSSSWWAPYWAPLVLLSLSLLSYSYWKVWRNARNC